jgi:hypothetical protein
MNNKKTRNLLHFLVGLMFAMYFLGADYSLSYWWTGLPLLLLQMILIEILYRHMENKRN